MIDTLPVVIRVPQLPARTILREHIIIAHETIARHRSGMSAAMITQVRAEIADLERLEKYAEEDR